MIKDEDVEEVYTEVQKLLDKYKITINQLVEWYKYQRIRNLFKRT